VANDFVLAISPAAQELTAGGPAKSFAVTAAFSSTPQPVTLGVSALAAGMSASFDPPVLPPGGSSTLLLSAGSTAAIGGPTSLTVTGAADDAPAGHTAVATYSVNKPTAVTIENLGFDQSNGAVTLSVSAPGALLTLRLYDGDALIASSAQSPLLARWDTRTAVNGLHTLVAVVVGADGNSTSTAMQVAVQNDFALSLPQASAQLLAGGAGIDVPLDTSPVGAAEPIALSLGDVPDGVTVTIDPNPVLAGKTATLHLLAAPGAAAGSATLAVRGATWSVPSSGHSASLALAVSVSGPPAQSSGKGCSSAGSAWSALLVLACFSLRTSRYFSRIERMTTSGHYSSRAISARGHDVQRRSQPLAGHRHT
jgi:hypothetical protein